MNEADLAYLAGLIDGEGSIHINRSLNKFHVTVDGVKREYVGYSVRVDIANTSLRLLTWVQERFGGHITEGKYKHDKPWKRMYHLSFRRAEIEKILPRIEPYLVLKKEQANQVLAFMRSRSDKRQLRKSAIDGRLLARPYTEAELQIVATVRRLNL